MHIVLRIIRLFRKYWKRAIVAYTCLFLGAGLAVLIPRYTGQAVDLALKSNQRSALITTALIIAGIGILRSVLTYGQNYLGEYISQKVAYDIRNALYDRLQRLSYAFHDRSQTGQLMSRATADVEGVRAFVGFALLRGFYFLVLLIVIVVLLFILDWRMALLSLSVLPFISYRTIRISRKLRVIWMKIQQGLGVLGTIVQENLAGTRVVRAFAREDFESQKFHQQAETIYNREIEANNLLASNSPVISFVLLLAMGGILWYGGRQVVAGSITPGELTQFLLYVVMLTMPVRMLGWLTILYSRAMSSGQRIFEVLDEVSDIKESSSPIDSGRVNGLVCFENVSFHYSSQGTALENISFEVKPGQIIAFVGASGSGKSTVANLIPRFYDVSSGRITLDGIDIKNYSLSSLRHNVGIVQQDTFLFSATIKENIGYGKPDATMDEIVKVARIAQLHDFIIGLPDGYATWVGERGITLSGGQKQRLAIARTLLLDPGIVILDDSTSSVDAETENSIWQALNALLSGRTAFIIAQRLHSVQIANLILVLQDGRVVERGTHDELLGHGKLYKQLYDLQFQNQNDHEILQLDHPEVLAHDTGILPPGHEERQQNTEDILRNSLRVSDDTIYGKPYDSRVVSRLAKYFTPYKKAVPLTIAATLLYTFSIVANPYLVGRAIDNYVNVGDLGGLNIILLLFLGNSILNLISYYVQIRAEAVVGQGVLLNLRNQIFRHLQQLSISFFDRNEIGRIMSRVQNDVEQLGDFLDSGAFWVTGEVLTLIAISVTMFALDFTLALIALSVVPLLFIFIILWQKTARHSFIKIRQAISVVNGALQENISGIRVIQSLSREDINARHFDEVNHAHFQANVVAARLSAAMMPVAELLMILAIALVTVFGGTNVMQGGLLVGTLVAFTLYIQDFFDPIRALTMEYAQLQRAMASGSRVFELLDVEPEITQSQSTKLLPRLKGEIIFHDVSFGYQSSMEILHDINIRIPAGETVALVGPTGAGKSTIISLIARFYDVTRGKIIVDNQDLREIDLTSYRRQLGVVFQDPFLFSGTIRSNICYANPDATQEEMISAAQTVHAHDFIVKLEHGYDTLLYERGQNLSMGQRQLISFARALLANPAILLLDEATSNVDSYSEHLLQQALEHLLKGRTALVIAHRLSTVRNANRILVLDQGSIVEEGNHNQLLEKGGLYARLYAMSSSVSSDRHNSA